MKLTTDPYELQLCLQRERREHLRTCFENRQQVKVCSDTVQSPPGSNGWMYLGQYIESGTAFPSVSARYFEFDEEGELVITAPWQREPSPPPTDTPRYTVPACFGNRLFVGMGQSDPPHIYELHPTTGEIIALHEVPGGVEHMEFDSLGRLWRSTFLSLHIHPDINNLQFWEPYQRPGSGTFNRVEWKFGANKQGWFFVAGNDQCRVFTPEGGQYATFTANGAQSGFGSWSEIAIGEDALYSGSAGSNTRFCKFAFNGAPIWHLQTSGIPGASFDAIREFDDYVLAHRNISGSGSLEKRSKEDGSLIESITTGSNFQVGFLMSGASLMHREDQLWMVTGHRRSQGMRLIDINNMEVLSNLSFTGFPGGGRAASHPRTNWKVLL